MKERFLVVEYDPNGNISEMQIYKSNDILDYKVVFGYDENNNMITDTDYNPDGTIAENIEYKYDEMGRVVNQLNYEGEGEVDSKFTFETDNNSNTLILNKYKPLETIEYQIIYKYDGNVDRGNNVEIIKQKLGGELIMRVENVYDENNFRLQKKIFNEQNQLMYYFEYNYFRDSDKFSTISKFSPDKQLLSKTIYSRHDSGLIVNIQTIDAEGNILSFSSYSYNN